MLKKLQEKEKIGDDSLKQELEVLKKILEI